MMRGPDFRQYFCKQYQEKGYRQYFDQEVDPEGKIIMAQPVIDQQVGDQDNADIHKTVGDQHRRQ